MPRSSEPTTLQETVNPSDAEAAFRALESRLLALPAGDKLAPRFNLRIAASHAVHLSIDLHQPERYARFQNLAGAGEFDPRHLDELERIARAAWWVRHRLELAEATASEAQLPASLVEEAGEVRKRMLKVAVFHFEDDPELGPQIAYIRSGTGYQDLLDDLFGLGRIYHEQKAVLAATPRHYRPEDEDLAYTLANDMIARLGASPASPGGWGDLQARVTPVLLGAYDEVAAAGRFLFRKEPWAEAAFASLYRIGRSRPSRGRRRGETPTDPLASA